MQTKEFVDEVLADFGEGDYLILHNVLAADCLPVQIGDNYEE